MSKDNELEDRDDDMMTVAEFFAEEDDGYEETTPQKRSYYRLCFEKLLSMQPQRADLYDLSSLDGHDWRCLLIALPRYAERCDWNKLDGADWKILLSHQPQFSTLFEQKKLNAANPNAFLGKYSRCQSKSECDDFFENFKRLYTALSAKSKEIMAMLPNIKTMEDSENAVCIMKILAVIEKSNGQESLEETAKSIAAIECPEENCESEDCDEEEAIDWESLIDENGHAEIPKEVKVIEDGAFEDCDDLESITIPEGVVEIGDCAFCGCGSIKKIQIPSTVKKIGYSAFACCECLEEVRLPAGLQEIQEDAFDGCPSLRKVYGPSLVADECVFEDHEECRFYDINVEDEEESWEFIYGSKIERADLRAELWDVLVKHCPNFKDRKTCRWETFRKYIFDEMTTDDIEDFVQTYDRYEGHFWGMRAGDYDEDNVEWEGEGCDSDEEEMIDWKSFIDENGHAEIPEGVKIIEDRAFAGYDDLKSITIPEGVVEIGNWAFSGCHSLIEIRIPSTVKWIGVGAFSDCDDLKSITIPEGVVQIGNWAFSGCHSLKEIRIPSTVKWIGGGAFNCNSLERVYAPGRVADACEIEGNGLCRFCDTDVENEESWEIISGSKIERADLRDELWDEIVKRRPNFKNRKTCSWETFRKYIFDEMWPGDIEDFIDKYPQFEGFFR